MDRPQVQSKVRSIICSQLTLTPDQLSEATHLENDLKADSLDITEIGMSLEDEFQITIEDSDLARLKTIGDAVNHICEAKGIPLAVTPALKLAKPTYAALQPSPSAPPLPARDCKSCGAHSATGAICSFCGRAL